MINAPIIYAHTINGMSADDEYWVGVDCIKCEVTEERNGAYELSMEFPVVASDGTRVADWVKKFARVKVVPNPHTREQNFLIYQTETDGKTITARAHHSYYALKNYPVGLMTSVSEIPGAMAQLQSKIYDRTTILGGSNKYEFEGAGISPLGGNAYSTETVMSAYDVLMDMVDYFDGEIFVNQNYVSIECPTRGYFHDITLAYGVNIKSISVVEADDDTHAGVYPFYTAINSSGTRRTAQPSSAVSDISIIGWKKWKIEDVTQRYAEDAYDDGDVSASSLNSVSQSELVSVSSTGTRMIEVVTPTIPKGDDLADLRLCDSVMLDYEPLGIHEKVQLTKYTYDVLNEVYTELVFGNSMSLSKTLVNQERASRTYTASKKEYRNRYNFTWTRCGNMVTMSQSGNVKPTATAATWGNVIPRGYRPKTTQVVWADDPNVANSKGTYHLTKTGGVQFNFASTVSAQRNFTITYKTADPYPRTGWK